MYTGQNKVADNTLSKNTQLHIYTTISDIDDIWDTFIPINSTLLRSAYLHTIEKCPPANMQFYYVVFKQDENVCGVSLFQSYVIKAKDSINNDRYETVEQNPYCVINDIARSFKTLLINHTELHLLINGNMLLTGEFGNYSLPTFDLSEYIDKAFDKVAEKVQQTNRKAGLYLVKDYKDDQNTWNHSIIKKDYKPIKMQPSMHLSIDENWNSIEDYLADITSKYRVRYKKAKKVGLPIAKKELDYQTCLDLKDDINKLYKNVADSVGFNAFTLHENYFLLLKKELNEKYKIFGYFINNQLVAFYTIISHDTTNYAHFLGYDKSINREYKIYLNILYDILEKSIHDNASCIDFARTALEIKSTLGAEPVEMLCFFKHKNYFSNKFWNFVYDYLNPKEEWIQRKPFKSK